MLGSRLRALRGGLQELGVETSHLDFTGIGNLSTHNQILTRSANSPIAPHVTYHTILGNKKVEPPSGVRPRLMKGS